MIKALRFIHNLSAGTRDSPATIIDCPRSTAQGANRTQAGSLCYINFRECGAMFSKSSDERSTNRRQPRDDL